MVRRSEIKRGVWPGIITMWPHKHKVILEVAFINDTRRKQRFKQASNLQREVFFFFFKLVRRPHPLYSLHSCWSWCAPAVLSTGFCKAKKKSFPGETNMGSHQLLLSLCQRQQLNISPDTDLLLLQPSWKLKAVSEPQKYYSRIFEGVKKKKKKKKKSSFSSALWLSGHRWNTKCPPDVFLILWYIYRFSGSYQETAHANSTNCRKE